MYARFPRRFAFAVLLAVHTAAADDDSAGSAADASGSAESADGAATSSTGAGATSSGSLEQMLNSIPEIEAPKKPAQTQADKDPAPKAHADMDFGAYVKSCQRAVYRNWHPKAKLVAHHPDLLAQFLVKLDAEGHVIGVSIARSSGKRAFDKSAFEAITATDAFPAPPSLMQEAAAKGVLVEFTAAGAAGQ